jgi:hypothetical protein
MRRTTETTAPRELAFRAAGGVEVALLWWERQGSLTVSVVNRPAGYAFGLDVGDADPLDVFHHPYWYAAARSVQYVTAPPDVAAATM